MSSLIDNSLSDTNFHTSLHSSLEPSIAMPVTDSSMDANHRLSVMSVNLSQAGVQGKYREITQFLDEYEPDVLMLQECHCTSEDFKYLLPEFHKDAPNYTLHCNLVSKDTAKRINTTNTEKWRLQKDTK